jgi:hypothetical protein
VFGDSVIADAIRDRLQHSALTIHITGESYRGVKAKKLASRKKDVTALPHPGIDRYRCAR